MRSSEVTAPLSEGPTRGGDGGEPRRFSRNPAEAPLLEAMRAGEARVAVVFGGQGAPWLPALRDLHGQHLAVRSLVRAASDRLRASAASPRFGALATPARGFDLARWIDDPAAAQIGRAHV